MITITQNQSLTGRNSFRLPASASVFIETDSLDDLSSWIRSNPVAESKVLILGGGSNLLLTSDFDGYVIHPVNRDIEIVYEDHYSVGVKAGAGANWDGFVEWCVKKGYAGLENLSWIPGTVGAAPIQNIGAYGTEAANLVDSVEVVDLKTFRRFNLEAAECKFAYRDSIFKKPEGSKWLVWSVTFRLDKEPIVDISYDSLKKYFKNKAKPTLEEVRQAVIEIRKSKLPDPEVVPNAGSFFKNPVVSPCQANLMKQDFPDLPLYAHDVASVKIAAGYLIEQCGWKGFREGDAGVNPDQALVLVNYGNATARELLDLADKIKASVKERFHIKLEPEVRII
jgi:UDP-N-acetylmuramate dehydrogenase